MSTRAVFRKVKGFIKLAASGVEPPVSNRGIDKVGGVEKVFSCLGVHAHCAIRINRPCDKKRKENMTEGFTVRTCATAILGVTSSGEIMHSKSGCDDVGSCGFVNPGIA